MNKYFIYITFLGPLVESYAVFRAMDAEMDWNPVFVYIAAALVALTGFWGVQVMNAMAEFNATMRAGEKQFKWNLPTWKAIVVLGIWFTGVTLLTVFLDVSPAMKEWTPLGLVVIGFSASYLFSLSNLHATNVEEREAHRQSVQKNKQDAAEEKKAERKARKERAQVVASKKQEVTQLMKEKGVALQPKGNGKISDELLLVYWEMDPTLTPTAMAKRLVEDGAVNKITRQAISGRLDGMVKRGLVVVQDGRVVTYAQVGEGSGAESGLMDGGEA